MENECHSSAQPAVHQNCPDQGNWASGHGKHSQFQKSSKGTCEFPRLIKIKSLLYLVGWGEAWAVWQDGRPGMVPIKSGPQKGGVLSPPWNMGSGRWQPSAQDLPAQFLFLFLMRKEPGVFCFVLLFFLLFFVCFFSGLLNLLFSF